MSEVNRCPECGVVLPASAPRGHCPACLLKRGLETNTVGDTSSAARWIPPGVEEVAGRFPELEVSQLIGRGGMGAVYQARQRNLDRVVALKILPPEMGQEPAFAERFAREAQAMAKLSHPHIVAIHEFGERAGWYFLVMEYVDGVNLRGLLDSGNISPKEALAIVPQICEALQYAHDQGIVHRDIKPENILLNKQGQVKIADFGLAKLMGRTAGGAGAGATEKVMGTPQYMAPEQMEQPAAVDHRADIYSLGVVFYQMLTGELPVGRFAPPSKKVQIDVRLDEVVLRALEREPAKRYQQVSEVRTEVETIVGTPRAVDALPRMGREEGRVGVTTPARFSLMAIMGAIWGMFAVPTALFFLVASFEGGPGKSPNMLGILLAVLLVPLGVTAPFGTTILGCVALARIRNSGGRIYGRGMAFFDAMVFPVLAVDFGIYCLCLFIMGRRSIRSWFDHEPRLAWADYEVVGITLTVILILLLDFMFLRMVWRVESRPADRAGDSSHGPGKANRVALAAIFGSMMLGIFGTAVLTRHWTEQGGGHGPPLQPEIAAARNGEALEVLPTISGPRLQFRMVRAAGDTTSAVDEIPDPRVEGGKLLLLKQVLLDEKAVAMAAFDPTPVNFYPKPIVWSPSVNLFFTKAGAEAFAKIPHEVEVRGALTIEKQILVALLDGRLLWVSRLESGIPPGSAVLYVPGPASRAETEKVVATLNSLSGVSPERKFFRGGAAILEGLPAEAQPGAEGWDEFSKPKADAWLEEALSRRGYTAEFEVEVQSVRVKRISPKDKLNETMRWDVELTLGRVPFEIHGFKAAVKLDSFTLPDPNATTFTLYQATSVVTVAGDETFARRAKALQAGDKVMIRGTISKAVVWEKNPPELWILLSDPALVMPASSAPASAPR